MLEEEKEAEQKLTSRRAFQQPSFA